MQSAYLRVSAQELPGVIQRMEERLSRETAPELAEDLWTANYLLMGLLYPTDFVSTLLQGVRNMRESSTYQAILSAGEAIGEARGRVEEARKTILTLGRKRFGAMPAPLQASLDALSDVGALDAIISRILDVEIWDELLVR